MHLTSARVAVHTCLGIQQFVPKRERSVSLKRLPEERPYLKTGNEDGPSMQGDVRCRSPRALVLTMHAPISPDISTGHPDAPTPTRRMHR